MVIVLLGSSVLSLTVWTLTWAVLAPLKIVTDVGAVPLTMEPVSVTDRSTARLEPVLPVRVTVNSAVSPSLEALVASAPIVTVGVVGGGVASVRAVAEAHWDLTGMAFGASPTLRVARTQKR